MIERLTFPTAPSAFFPERRYKWLWCETCSLFVWHEWDGKGWLCMCGRVEESLAEQARKAVKETCNA